MRIRIRKIVSIIPVFIYTIYRILSHLPDNFNDDENNTKAIMEKSLHIKTSHGVSDNATVLILNETSSYHPSYNSNGSRFITNQNYLINCNNINDIEIKRKLGNGVSKQGFLGYFKGRSVVLKLTSANLLEVPRCVGNLFPSKVRHKVCQEYSRMKIMKEILTLHEIAHNTIAPLVGYCVKGSVLHSDGVTDVGFVSIIDWGENITPVNIVKQHWTYRLKMAHGIAEIIDYLANSPIGSINYPDFKVSHFKLFNSTVKMIDFDMVYNQERACDALTPCSLGLDCIQNYCIGYNVRYNLARMRDVFGPLLLRQSSYPKHISSDIDEICKQLESGLVNSTQVLKLFETLRKKIS